MPYRPVGPTLDLPEVEREVLGFWREARIFQRTLEARRDAPPWVFYEGPPTANGRPGIHHVEARTFKDVYPRFRTMTGYRVMRKAGWDCHGLPVELEVEKEIGTRSKRDIEDFGIEEFNRRCRESVTRYVEDWARLTERIGFWLDLSDPYWTMDPRYIESVWWSLKRLHTDGLLYEADRSVAYCPRCETALSDHEVALGYAQVVDPAVFVRLPVTDAPAAALKGASLLIWTTTPWTLIANTGAAVAADEPYAVVDAPGGPVVVAERLVPEVLGPDAAPRATLPGSRVAGARYEPPYPNVGEAHVAVTADFVSMNEGTGIVHIATGFGADDLELGRREGWPVVRPIDDAGRFTDETPVEWVRGRFVKDADDDIIADLRNRGLLLRDERYEHTYPLCWRCETPLLYVARTSWYVRTTARKDRLLEVNEEVGWHPDHIKHGRYGDWLRNNVDWALSRERYWGTPLPVWRCARGHVTVVGSLAELSELAGRDVTSVDPHRPAIDEVALSCPERDCGAEARRVKEVIDAWYDSGAMPFAQWGYHPDLGRGIEERERAFPGDFIAEAIDQTRGWFYSLMAEGVLLFDSTAYRHVVCLGLLVDRDGRKMSKRLGNVIDPWTIIDVHGADALRWFMITSGSPWDTRRVYPEAVQDVVRGFLLTLWNVHSFYVTYANADGVEPNGSVVPPAERPLLDRWLRSRLHRTVEGARRGLDAYDATGAGRLIAGFVDDLSNWYVRRARRRFWDPAGEGGTEKAAAYQTLEESLVTLARLLAPFTPFVAEALWRSLSAGRGDAPESVHMAEYPVAEDGARDDELEAAMEEARAAVALGRTVRAREGIRVRQPLARAVVRPAGDPSRLDSLADLIAEELNVKVVDVGRSPEELGRWRAKPRYPVLGPRLGPRVDGVASALERDDGSLAAALAGGGTVEVPVDGDRVAIGPEDVELARETAPGWGVGSGGGVTVALDLRITPRLRREGIARDLVRVVQDARKDAGLEVTDRIVVALQADGDAALAVDEQREWIAGEILAERIEEGRPTFDAFATETLDADGSEVRVSLGRA